VLLLSGLSLEGKLAKNRSLHPASRPFGVRVRPHCVQLGLVESGLRCGELGARHPWIELQPHLVPLVVNIAGGVKIAASLVCTDILLATQTPFFSSLHSTCAEHGKTRGTSCGGWRVT